MAENRAGRVWMLCSIALWAIACVNSGGLDSGVAGDKQLKNLSNKEIQKICDAADVFIAAALPVDVQARASCAQQALMPFIPGPSSRATPAPTGDDYAMCQAAYQQCVDALQGDGGMISNASILPQTSSMQLQCFSMSELASCKATVDQLQSCIQNTYAAQSRALQAASCQLLETTDPTAALSLVPMSSSACDALDKACPGLSKLSQRAGTPITNPIGNPVPQQTPNANVACADLGLSFDGSDCSTTSCSTSASCTCSSTPMSYRTCNSVKGCLVSADCSVACTTSSSKVQSCAQETTCQDDSDCGGAYCVKSASASTGTCSRGKPGDACMEDGDCQSSSCAADSSGGSMRCKGTATSGTTCTSAVECASGICVQDFSRGTRTCSDGANGDPCSTSTDCMSGSCVYTSGTGQHCTDRMNGSPCSSDSDCDSGHCASGGGTSSTCVAGMPGDPCDSSSDCVSGRCVTSQTDFMETCAYSSGDTCPGGIADCNGQCRSRQASCSGTSCDATCSASCSTATFATWSATDKASGITLSNGDLTATGSSSEVAVRATVGKTSGKYYWEVTAESASSTYAVVGVMSMSSLLDFGLGSVGPGAGFAASGSITSYSSGGGTACMFSSGTVIGVALDLDSGMVYFSLDGVWQAGGNPDSSTGGTAFGSTSEAMYPAVSLGIGDVLTANFGQSAFAYVPPSGFTALTQ